jgi:hypothetical protein
LDHVGVKVDGERLEVLVKDNRRGACRATTARGDGGALDPKVGVDGRTSTSIEDGRVPVRLDRGSGGKAGEEEGGKDRAHIGRGLYRMRESARFSRSRSWGADLEAIDMSGE